MVEVGGKEGFKEEVEMEQELDRRGSGGGVDGGWTRQRQPCY